MADTTPARRRPLLELDTVAPDRETVLIRTRRDRRGKHYEIAALDDLSIADRAEIGRLQATLQEIAPQVDAALDGTLADGDADVALFEQTLDRFLRVVIRELPQTVLDRLRISQKEQLLDAFTQASPEIARAVKAAAGEATPARRSRGSNGSTAATRSAGSASARRS